MDAHASRKRPAPALIRVGGATLIPSLLAELGLDAEAIIRRAGIEAKLLASADSLISYAGLGRLVQICVRETRCEHFGLLVIQRSGSAYLGILRSIAHNSPDVGSALSNLIRYFHHHDQAAWLRLVIEGERARLEYVMPPRSIGGDVIADGAMAVAHDLLKDLTPPAWAPTKVLLPRPRPADPAPYLALFGPTVEFGAAASALVFASHWLAEPIPLASISLRMLIERHLEAIDHDHSTRFSDQLRRVIVAGIGAQEPSIEMAAATLAISRRTLSRRLRQENVNFRDVVDEVRQTMAQELLAATDASVAAIAQQLRYSEPSVFVRAFRRWTGVSPGAWRLRCKTAGPAETPPD